MDPSWCPGCDRLILPKRFLVPVNTTTTSTSTNNNTNNGSSSSDSQTAAVNQQQQQPSLPPLPPPPPPASTPVPSSPQVRKKHHHPGGQGRQTKRLGGGLVDGTGRFKLGAPPLKTSGNSTTAATSKKESQPTTTQQPPSRKSRVVISQDPTPLYCSEECRVRDLKNSFIESDSAGFAGAPAALNHIAKLQHIQQLEKRIQSQKSHLTRRHSSNVTPTLSSTTVTACASQPSTSAPRPKLKPIFRTCSYSSTSTTSSAAKNNTSGSNPTDTTTTATPATTNDTHQRTIRPSPRRNSSTSALWSRSAPSWGSPTKAALAPPATNLFHASSNSSCSLDTNAATTSSVSMMSLSSLFETDSPVRAMMVKSGKSQSVDTEKTTPPSGGGSGIIASGSGTTDEKKKTKRVSFAGDSKPLMVESPKEMDVTDMASHQYPHHRRSTSSSNVITNTTTTNEDWRTLRAHKRNPLQDAHPLLEALSLSPKDRIARPSSLPITAEAAGRAYRNTDNTSATTTTSANAPHHPPPAAVPLTASHSNPTIPARASCMRNNRSSNSASAIYKVAMWPEDEKRTTESAKVHGELLRGYAKRFGPREGRSLVWGQLWVSADRASSSSTSTSSPSPPSVDGPSVHHHHHHHHHRSPTSPSHPDTPDHESYSDSDRTYWTYWESQQAALRARRKAESEVARLEEERVIKELLDGAGMREEDQPQARRMRRMAYDGMPGPAELRGLTYRFEKFLYDLGELSMQDQQSEAGAQYWGGMQQEKKRLFNFEED